MTKLTMLRNTFGMHAPMRLLMERQAVSSTRTLPQSNLHLDILMGRDEVIEPIDIFLGLYLPSHWGCTTESLSRYGNWTFIR
ncbi:hypothetical protein Ac2012v2_000457 [Leucoagaricus gongylophorus]